MLLEGFLWLAILVSCLAALLLVKGGHAGAVNLMEPQSRLWWGWLLVFYGIVAVVLGLLAILASLAMRRVPVGGVLLRSVAGAILLIALIWNGPVLIRMVSGVADGGLSWITTFAVLSAGSGLAGLALGFFNTKRSLIRVLSLLAAGLCFFALPGASGDDGVEAPDLPVASSTTGERLLVIGLDGADWDFLTPLLDRGDLPNLEALRDKGIWGDLATIRPTRSAPIWTSVVTGLRPKRHGVVNNSVERLRGSYHRLPNQLPLPRGLGVGLLEIFLRQRGLIGLSTVASFDRKVPALWNIATANGSPVDIVNWWASWPAEEIRGHVISDRTHFWRLEARGYVVDRGYVTYPDSLLVDLAPLILRPDQVTRDDALQFMDVSMDEFEEMKTIPYRHHRLKSEFKYFYSMFVSNLRMSLYLMDLGRRDIGKPADQFVLFRVIDQTSHQALEYSEMVDKHLGSSAEEIEKFSRVVTKAYRAADQAVGELLEAFGPGNVVVLSDHGFKLQGRRSRRPTYGHSGSSPPDGIIIASGPAFRSGRVEGLGIYDMMPLFMALKGWPVAEDFVRGVPERVFEESFLRTNLPELIETYGTMRVSLPEGGPIVADDEMVERLRALGYLE